MENSNENHDSDSVDTLTSSDENQSDDDRDDVGSDDETESYRSLTFSVHSNRSTATVKSKKTKKRVQFKPGASLVLVYIIPNREMLGLKSESEDSEDSDDDGEDSDDEDEDESEEESEEDENDDDDDDDDSDEKNKNKNKKPKPFARLMAVKQVNTHTKCDRKNVKSARKKNSDLINLNINNLTQKPPRRNNRANRKRERKERPKCNKKDNTTIDNKSKQGKTKRTNNKVNVINVDLDKHRKSRRNKTGIIEIKTTVQGDYKQATTASVPKLMYKNDLRPSVVNVNGALTVCQTKLLQRSRLQPMSLRVSRVDNRPSSCSYPRTDCQTNVRHVVSTGYDSISSLLPDSYNGFRQSLSTDTLKNLDLETHSQKHYIKRLDPDSMNDSSKRHYAWQVANGNISSQSLRTPSILPFWDSLRGTVSECNTVKLPS